MKRIVFLIVAFTLLLAACVPNKPPVTQPAATDAPTIGAEFDINNWDSVLAAAQGQIVNWYIWGGSDSINAFVDNFYGNALKERYASL